MHSHMGTSLRHREKLDLWKQLSAYLHRVQGLKLQIADNVHVFPIRIIETIYLCTTCCWRRHRIRLQVWTRRPSMKKCRHRMKFPFLKETIYDRHNSFQSLDWSYRCHQCHRRLGYKLARIATTIFYLQYCRTEVDLESPVFGKPWCAFDQTTSMNRPKRSKALLSYHNLLKIVLTILLLA